MRISNIQILKYVKSALAIDYLSANSDIEDIEVDEQNNEFCGNEIEPELENLIQNSYDERINDLNEVLKNHESKLDQMDFIQNELKRINTIISGRVAWARSGRLVTFCQVHLWFES